jgi:AraC-like DNA-binding protein
MKRERRRLLMRRDLLADIAEKRERITPYRHIFSGVNNFLKCAPENVLLFTRKTLEEEAAFRHSHHRFMLILNFMGDELLCVDEKIVDFPRNSIAFVLPGQLHYYLKNIGGRIDWLFITFDMKDCSLFFPFRNRTVPFDDEILLAAGKIIDLYSNLMSGSGSAEHLSFALGDFLFDLLEKIPPEETKEEMSDSLRQEKMKRLELMNKINQYIFSNIGAVPRAGDLAAHLNISVSHLRFLFKKHFRIALGAYVSKIKMDKAKLELRESDISVSELAQKYGYSSVFSFSHCFKSAAGVSPASYRASKGG